jgi:hypothetical protein
MLDAVRAKGYAPKLMEGRLDQLQRFPAPGERSLSFEAWLEDVSPRLSWDEPHLVYIREHLDRIADGSLRKLMLFVPLRNGKSQLVTIRFPAWLLERWPHKR